MEALLLSRQLLIIWFIRKDEIILEKSFVLFLVVRIGNPCAYFRYGLLDYCN